MKRLASGISGPIFGGAHNQAMELAEPLAARGWETAVILPSEPGDAAPRLREAGLEVITTPMSRLRLARTPDPFLRFATDFQPQVRRLAAIIESMGADVVQVHGPVHPQPAIAARRAGAGVVWQL